MVSRIFVLIFSLCSLLCINVQAIEINSSVEVKTVQCGPKVADLRVGNGVPIFQGSSLGRGIINVTQHQCDGTNCMGNKIDCPYTWPTKCCVWVGFTPSYCVDDNLSGCHLTYCVS